VFINWSPVTGQLAVSVEFTQTVWSGEVFSEQATVLFGHFIVFASTLVTLMKGVPLCLPQMYLLKVFCCSLGSSMDIFTHGESASSFSPKMMAYCPTVITLVTLVFGSVT